MGAQQQKRDEHSCCSKQAVLQSHGIADCAGNERPDQRADADAEKDEGSSGSRIFRDEYACFYDQSGHGDGDTHAAKEDKHAEQHGVLDEKSRRQRAQ